MRQDSCSRVLKHVVGFRSHSDHMRAVLEIIVLRLSDDVFHITHVALSLVTLNAR